MSTHAVAGSASSSKSRSGLMDWLTTTDHKKIGLMYLAFAAINAWAGGLMAGIIRLHLYDLKWHVVSPEMFNQLLTMHGTFMIFLVAMTALAGFGNYMVPIMIGARDMAFPKLNAFSFWISIPAALMLYFSFLVKGGAAAGGWWSYPPLTTAQFMGGHGEDIWIVAIILLGISSLMGAINFLVTVIDMRAPGMTWGKLPLFVWTWVVTAWMLLLSLPVFTGALSMLLADRWLGTGFYRPALGGDPLLYQHLFWFFGHPEVYIVILPAFGIISHTICSFSHKKVFGYKGMVGAIWAIGILGFMVWAHHMFTAGISPEARVFFSMASLCISVPTGVKVYSWLASAWGGTIRFTVAMKFAFGFIALFIIGGMTGLMLAIVPFDIQVHNTYFVVGHFHYVFVGGTVMAIFAASYFWFPKMTGRMLNEKLGNWNFWLFFIGMNWTFFPMHILGIMGMARRVAFYRPEFKDLNQFISIGFIFMLLAGLLYTYNVVSTLLKPTNVTSNDPWEINEVQQGLEWMTSSPPPAYNFEEIPVIE